MKNLQTENQDDFLIDGSLSEIRMAFECAKRIRQHLERQKAKQTQRFDQHLMAIDEVIAQYQKSLNPN